MQQAKFFLDSLKFILLVALVCTLCPLIVQASVESSLLGVQNKLTRVILPVLSVDLPL